MAEDTHECREKLEDAEKRRIVTGVAANEMRDDAMTAEKIHQNLKLNVSLKWA